MMISLMQQSFELQQHSKLDYIFLFVILFPQVQKKKKIGNSLFLSLPFFIFHFSVTFSYVLSFWVSAAKTEMKEK